MGNRQGGMGKTLLLLIVIGIMVFAVYKMGVEEFSNKAGNSIGNVADKISNGIGSIGSSKDESEIDYKSDRPYKEYNQQVVDYINQNTVDKIEKPDEKFNINYFSDKSDKKTYILVSDDNSTPGWEKFENKKCTTYKAMLIENGNKVEMDDNCNITYGIWEDQYGVIEKNNKGNDTKEEIEYNKISNPKNVVVSRVITLENAWNTGADNSLSSDRTSLSNDRMNNFITIKEVEQNKGNKTIDKWTPPINSKHYCDYADRYGAIKARYKLKFAEEEAETLKNIYTKCNK